MTWLLQRVLDLIEIIVNWLYARKYGAMARRFGRGTAEDDGRRGLIILQIDGLSHATVQKALAQGVMPHLKRMIERDGYGLQPWSCGIPSSTPAVQGGLMYGNNWNIPAFRWYEKHTGRTLVAKRPRDARVLQNRLSAGRRGLLAGGSSYVNIYDGGARLSLFTVSALGGERFFENVRGVSFATLLLLSPVRLLRLARDVLWDFLRDLGQRMISRLAPRPGAPLRPVSPLAALFQIFASVVFRELQTFGVLLDVYRRVPAIYANFYGYDEVAHQLGVYERETARVLRSIDGRIREIETCRRRFAARREYDLFVLSDHGMSPCIPFQEETGETLGQFLSSLVEQHHASVVLDEGESRQWRSNTEARYLIEELRGIHANLSPHTQKLAGALGNFVARRVPIDDEHEWDLRRQRDVVVRSSGTISLVYFNVTSRQMDLSDVELVYPGLLRGLVEEPAFGLILGRERGEAMAMTLRGPRRIRAFEDPLIRDLLDNLPNREDAAHQLARLVSFPDSGDLVLFGRWDSRGQTISFEPHWATHGGLGGEQNRPFMAVPPQAPWDVTCVTNSEQLYPLFMARYGPPNP